MRCFILALLNFTGFAIDYAKSVEKTDTNMGSLCGPSLVLISKMGLSWAQCLGPRKGAQAVVMQPHSLARPWETLCAPSDPVSSEWGPTRMGKQWPACFHCEANEKENCCVQAL